MGLLIRAARSLAAWAFTAFYWTAIFLLQAATLKNLSTAFLQRALRRWGFTTLRILAIRLELEGESTLETREPRVIIFNHQSALDMMIAAAVAPPALLAVGKKEIIYVPFVNLAWWVLDFIGVDRKHPRKMVAAIGQIADTINRDRRSLLISPEGTRTYDGALLPFKRGPFQIAVRAQVPLCPYLIWGAFELLPRTGWLPMPGVIRVRYLPPIETRGVPEDGAGALAEKARMEMTRAYAAGA